MTTPISKFWSLEDALRTSQLVPNQIEQTLRYGRIHSKEQVRKDLERTAKILLDPFCEKFGKGVMSSGYRCPDLNKIVGGSSNSAHTVGLAIDWQPPCAIAVAIEWALAQPKEELPFDRLIVEERGKTRWLHVQAAEEGWEMARKVFHSPKAGIYLQLTPEQVLRLDV